MLNDMSIKDKYYYIISEIEEIKSLLQSIPEENEIDRKSLEWRLERLRASLEPCAEPIRNPDRAVRLSRMLNAWADTNGVLFHHGETLRGVSRDDLLALVSFVDTETRKWCAQKVEGERFRDGEHYMRRGPCGVGTWNESSPFGYATRTISRCIMAG